MQPPDQEIFQRAISSLQTGALQDAEHGLMEVLRLNPKHVGALNVLGIVLTQQARYDEAEGFIRRAIALDARSEATFCNHGIVLKALGRAGEAYDAFSKAIEITPVAAESWNNRGTVLNDLGRFREAITDFQRAIALNPRFAEAYYNMGRSLAELEDYAAALAAYDAALKLKPDFADAYENRGNTLHEMKRHEEALESYRRALALRPQHAETLFNCGVMAFELRRYTDAIDYLERARAVDPKLKYLAGKLLHTKMFVCDWRDFERERAALIAAVRSGLAAATPFEFIAVASSAEDQLHCARTVAAQKYAVEGPQAFQGRRPAHERIRLGYASADFHSHATASLIAELFELHDRRRFEVLGFSFGPDDRSAARSRIAGAFDRFFDVGSMSDADIARKVRECEVDISVDLKGYTADSRPRVFALRSAPVQVSYLGYPGTMGVDFIDYIIADPVVVPLDAQAFYAEKVVQLPDCYQVNDRKRAIAAQSPTRAEAGLPADRFVFCCFNNSWKLTPAMFDTWMRLLRAVEGSVLWLLRDNTAEEENLRREGAARGVDSERLVFAGRLGIPEHLARHRLADLFLDTLPYNAHTTASDALWAGLPVLTCRGEAFAGRVAASLLCAAGIPELVTTNLADYEALALKLARDPAMLGAIKAKLARNRDTCTLFDTPRFTRHIEAAYRTMWETWRRGDPPRGFRVEPIAS